MSSSLRLSFSIPKALPSLNPRNHHPITISCQQKHPQQKKQISKCTSRVLGLALQVGGALAAVWSFLCLVSFHFIHWLVSHLKCLNRWQSLLLLLLGWIMKEKIWCGFWSNLESQPSSTSLLLQWVISINYIYMCVGEMLSDCLFVAHHHELAEEEMVQEEFTWDVCAVHVCFPLLSGVSDVRCTTNGAFSLVVNLSYIVVFGLCGRVLIWAPFLNFRKFPRDPAMKYPWSVPENPSEIKGGFLKYPWAQPEDYEV